MNHIEDSCKKWLDDNCAKSQLLGNTIFGLRPDVGSYVKVNDMEIIQEIFPAEFEQILMAYNSYMEKLSEYYKDKIKKDPLPF